jgi:hypothetical protein
MINIEQTQPVTVETDPETLYRGVDPQFRSKLIKAMSINSKSISDQINNRIQKPIENTLVSLNEELNKKEFLSVSGMAFIPIDNTERSIASNQVYPVSNLVMVAPVNLSHGYTINAMKYFVYSNSATQTISFQLERILDNGLLEVISTPIASKFLGQDQVLTDTFTATHTVNNEIGAYFIRATFTQFNDADLRINKVLIDYNR